MSDNVPNRYTPIPNRQEVTDEPDPAGRWSKHFPDMIGYGSQGGGKVPEDYGWNTNPKQWQEETTPATLAKRFNELRVLPNKPTAPALSEGKPAAPALPQGEKK